MLDRLHRFFIAARCFSPNYFLFPTNYTNFTNLLDIIFLLLFVKFVGKIKVLFFLDYFWLATERAHEPCVPTFLRCRLLAPTVHYLGWYIQSTEIGNLCFLEWGLVVWLFFIIFADCNNMHKKLNEIWLEKENNYLFFMKLR